MKDLFRRYQVTVLEGEQKALTLNGQCLNLCGIDDDEAGEATVQAQLAACSEAVDRDSFTLLLAHRPERIEQDYLGRGFDLVLSGHAHGGQWRIPGLINGLYAPGQGWFPQYAGGLYSFDNTTMIVGRGLSRESSAVPRVFNRPELVVITLEGEDTTG